MAPLAEFKVTAEKPAFSCIEADYVELSAVRLGHCIIERYVTVFTCLATKTVHLELIHSLDFISIELALQRFVNRRGNYVRSYTAMAQTLL